MKRETRRLGFLAVFCVALSSLGLQCPPSMNLEGEYWWVRSIGGGGADIFMATLTYTGTNQLELHMIHLDHGSQSDLGTFSGSQTSTGAVNFMNGPVVEWGFQGIDDDLDTKAEKLELLTFQGQPAPDPRPIFNLVDCPTCVSNKDGYFLNTSGVQETGLFFAADDATTFHGNLLFFAPGGVFPSTTFDITGGSHTFDGGFTATAVNASNAGDTRSLVGEAQDLDSDGTADQVVLRIDGGAPISMPRVAKLAYDLYKCWSGPGSCQPALGTPACAFSPAGGLHEYDATVTVPFKQGDGLVTPATARLGKQPTFGDTTIDGGPLPGSFTALGVGVTTSVVGTTAGTLTYDLDSWIADYAPSQALFEIADATGDSNQVSCASPADRTVEQQKIQATPVTRSATFGNDVAIDGTTAVVGARSDDIEGTNKVGAVYVFNRGATWSQVQRIKPADLDGTDNFGDQVELEGNTLAISNPGDASGAGSVSIYERTGGVFNLTQTLVASDAAANDNFGKGLSLDGDRLAIGSWHDAADVGTQRGSIYFFERSAGVWAQVAKIRIPGPGSDVDFGIDVALQGDLAVAGAGGDDGAAINAGALVVMQRIGGAWQVTAIVAEPIANSELGARVALDAGTLVASSRAGVRLFNYTGGWTETALIPLGQNLDPVLRGDLLLLGNPQDDDYGFASGAVNVFHRIAGVWTEVAKLEPTDSAREKSLGAAVDTDGTRIIAGAPGETLTGGFHEGTAYIFPVP